MNILRNVGLVAMERRVVVVVIDRLAVVGERYGFLHN